MLAPSFMKTGFGAEGNEECYSACALIDFASRRSVLAVPGLTMNGTP
jgi:hypothetical protein